MSNSPSPWRAYARAALLAVIVLVAIGLVSRVDPTRAAQLLPLLAAAAAVSVYRRRSLAAHTAMICNPTSHCRTDEANS